MRTGSSSTTQTWQSGSAPPAGATGGSQLLTPVLGADKRGEDLRSREAVVACTGGMPALDQLGDGVVVRQRVSGCAQQFDSPVQPRQRLPCIRFAHGPHQ